MTTEHERQLIREYGLQAREQFLERDWAYIAPVLQRLWENQTRHLSRWEDIEPLMRQAWSGHANSEGSSGPVKKTEEL